MNTPAKVLIVAGLAYWWWRRNQETLVEGPLQPVLVGVPSLDTPAAKLLATPIPNTPEARQLAVTLVRQAQEAQPQREQAWQERQTQQAVAAVQAVGDSEGAMHPFLTEAVDVSRRAQAQVQPAAVQPAAVPQPQASEAQPAQAQPAQAQPAQAQPAQAQPAQAQPAQAQPAPATQPQASEAQAVRAPQPQDAHSVQVTTTVGDDALLDGAQVKDALSPALRQAVQAIPPARIPFDDLSEFSQTVLLRGYAADYVAPQAIDEPAYSEAVKASTQSGLPIGWTQLLIARGVRPEQVGKVAVDLIDSFGGMLAKEALLADRDARKESRGAAQAGAAQADDPSLSGGVSGQASVRPQLDLKRLRGSLMGRFAPLPAGVKMQDGEA